MDITYIRAVFGALRSTVTKPLYKIDSGVILQIAGITDLPEYFNADFANSEKGTATRMLGHDGEVTIPDTLLQTGLPIFCWIYVVNETTGRTVYSVKIPVKQRSNVEDPQPTPEQADIITQAINALNQAGDNAEQAAESAQASAESAAQSVASIRGYAEDAQGYAEDAARSAGEAAQSAQTATNAAESAEESEAKSKGYADSAKENADRAEMSMKNAGCFWLEVDDNDDLIYIRTDNAGVDIRTDENDDLIVEAW
jgi:hypothetical protein